MAKTTFSGPISTSAISLALGPAPKFTAPIAGSTIDESAVFSWAGSAPSALYALRISSNINRTVFTTGTSVALGRLLALDGASVLGIV